ncbi:MAG: membrane protein insertase YidC [Myxococcota bacterium]|nr:membrane protein insertase YidC [Myxococcota bacterium]MDW8361009.1 membrane protein insertase YidC [Myxococcales bacterium]
MPADRRAAFVVVGLVAIALGLGSWLLLRPPSDAPATTAPSATPAGPSTTTKATARTALAAQDRARRERERRAIERRATIESRSIRATVSSLNGGLRSATLLSERYEDTSTGRPLEMVSTDKEAYLPFRVELVGISLPPDATWQLEPLGASAVRLRWEGDGVRVTRKLEARGDYQLWSTIRVENLGNSPRRVRARTGVFHWVPREHEGGGFFAAPSPRIAHGVCALSDRVERFGREDAYGGQNHGPGVRFAGVENTYFAMLVAAVGEPAEACWVRAEDRPSAAQPQGTLFEVRLVGRVVEIPPGGQTTFRVLGYVGPKETAALAAAGHGLLDAVDRGWFSTIADWLVRLLAELYGLVGNWGLAIILMTVLVRIALLPLTVQQLRSFAAMRRLKPELDAIQARYGDDREKKGAAIMELYRRHGVNPAAGCLPTLAQLPVWFAFYASLSTNVELYHADFALWWTDLSAPDPYFVLPLLLGVLMFVQQKITPTTMDPLQAKIMLYAMPAMITLFMLFLPAGLCLYMATNSVLGIVQQHIVTRHFERLDRAARASAPAPAAPATAPSEAAVHSPRPAPTAPGGKAPHSTRRNRGGR